MLKFGGHTLGRSLECNMRSKIRWFTDSANHTTYRISLRSSSLREPRHPLLRVISVNTSFSSLRKRRGDKKGKLHTRKFIGLPRPFGQGYKLVESVSVARVRPRTSKGITDLLLPQTSIRDPKNRAVLFSRLRSRSLTELTRQITPPTKNGHAPPPIESRKSSQSVNHTYVWTW
ncbi:unnamed protein product [Bathycoccus prasinos]